MRQLAGLFAVTFCVGVPMNTLLVLFPLLVHHTGAAVAAAGVLSGVVVLATVAFELATPWLVARWSAARALAGGCAVLGCAGVALAAAPSLAPLLIAGAVFGAGFGVSVTIAGALPGAIERQRGRGLAFGVFAIGSSLPTVVGPPLALLLAPSVGLEAVVVGCGAVALAGTVFCAPLARSLARSPAVARRVGRPSRRQVATLGAYGTITFAFGGIVTFASFHLADAALVSVAGFFLLLGIARTVGRTAAARLAQTRGLARVESLSLLASLLGLLLLLAVDVGPAVVAAALLFGFGFGAAQTTTLIDATTGDAVPGTSGAALWSFTTDAGMGLGALALAPVAAVLGYGGMFALLPAVALVGFLLHLYGSRAPLGREPRIRT